MDTILQFVQQHRTLTTLALGAVLGLLLGLAIGWWWWPVEWTNSTPGNLRSDFRNDYILWVAERYANTNDLEWARSKLGVEFWKEGQLEQTLTGLANDVGGQDKTRLLALAQALESTPPPEEPAPGLLQRLRPILSVCGVLVLLVLLTGAVWLVVGRLRASGVSEEGERRRSMVTKRAPPSPSSWGAEEEPLAQFPTNYMLGDDHYDPSFSIELESGEFVGECGVGISETIGVGAPNKVTAFEVWLFDKSDIRTVTKVLMSDYAFHDEALRAKLAPKGEPVLAKEGVEVTLETKTLRVQARVAEIEYGAGNLPPNSFFERLTIDLAAWGKSVQEGAQVLPESDVPASSPL